MSRLHALRRAVCAVAVMFSAGFASTAHANAEYGSFSQIIDSGPGIDQHFGHPMPVTFTFAGAPTLFGDGLLTVTATGNIGGGVGPDGIGENIRVDDYFGNVLGYVSGDNITGAEPVTLTHSLLFSESAWNTAL